MRHSSTNRGREKNRAESVGIIDWHEHTHEDRRDNNIPQGQHYQKERKKGVKEKKTKNKREKTDGTLTILNVYVMPSITQEKRGGGSEEERGASWCGLAVM